MNLEMKSVTDEPPGATVHVKADRVILPLVIGSTESSITSRLDIWTLKDTIIPILNPPSTFMGPTRDPTRILASKAGFKAGFGTAVDDVDAIKLPRP